MERKTKYQQFKDNILPWAVFAGIVYGLFIAINSIVEGAAMLSGII